MQRMELNIVQAMELRQSCEQDLGSVTQIVNNVLIGNVPNERDGFLINQPLNEEYLYRLQQNKFNIIAKIDNEVIGFLVAFSDSELRNNLDSGFLKYENDFFYKLFNDCHHKFIWLDQIAIFPKEYRRKNYGRAMLNEVINMAKAQGYHDFYGSISLCPSFNLASSHFIGSYGFKVIETVDISNRKWGIFYGFFA